MPIERRPANPLPKSYIPSGGLLFKVSDNDDWRSVAQKFGIDVNTLIEFNFKTRNPDEVNWYLRERVGCRKMTNDGVNWMFSSTAMPGIIYIPVHIHRQTTSRILHSVGAMSWIDPSLYHPEDLPEVDKIRPGAEPLRGALLARLGYRFANFLEGYIEVNSREEITDYGFTSESGLYYGPSFRGIMPEAYPVRRNAIKLAGGKGVRLVQLVGCRTQSPEAIASHESVKIVDSLLGMNRNWAGPIGTEAQQVGSNAGVRVAEFFGVFPPIWTELELTMHADGAFEARLIRHSIFPSHTLYLQNYTVEALTFNAEKYKWIESYDGTKLRLSEWRSKGWGSGNPWAVPDPRPLGADFPIRPDIPKE